MPSIRIEQLCPDVPKYFSGWSDDEIYFLDIFSSIYFTDITTATGRANISLEIPVSRSVLDVIDEKTLQSVVNFMVSSDDSSEVWTIKLTHEETRERVRETQQDLIPNQAEYVSLLSGGLDSFCGNLTPTENTVFVSYKNNQEEFSVSGVVYRLVQSVYQQEGRFADRITLKRAGGVTINHSTQRTRSLLYFALAILVAKARGIDKIKLCENGILSFNISLGRQTTKTTHPYVVSRMNQLIAQMDLGIKVEHPFLFSTKSEMIKLLRERTGDEGITSSFETRTCSRDKRAYTSTQFKRHGEQCGICVPCMLRRISYYSADVLDQTVYMDGRVVISDPTACRDWMSSSMYFTRLMELGRSERLVEDVAGLHPSDYEQDFGSVLKSIRDLFCRFSNEVEACLDAPFLYRGNV